MEHFTGAYLAGLGTPTNDEAFRTPHTKGPKDNGTQHFHSGAESVPNKEALSEASLFARLSRQYAAVGLRLYPLDGSTLLVTAPGLGMSRTLPDLRVAKLYLRQIGGVV